MLQRSQPVPGRHIWQKKHLLFITRPVKSPSCKKIQIQCPFIALILFLLYTLTLEQALNKEICAWHRNKWTKRVQPFQESCQGHPALGCEGIEEEGIGEEKKHKIVKVNYKMHQDFCFLISAGSSMLGEGHMSREVAEWQTAPTWGCHNILLLWAKEQFSYHLQRKIISLENKYILLPHPSETYLLKPWKDPFWAQHLEAEEIRPKHFREYNWESPFS